MRVTAGLSDEDLIDPLGMPTERGSPGAGDAGGEEEGSVMDGMRIALSTELQEGKENEDQGDERSC